MPPRGNFDAVARLLKRRQKPSTVLNVHTYEKMSIKFNWWSNTDVSIVVVSCERERERERECVCVGVCESERESE